MSDETTHISEIIEMIGILQGTMKNLIKASEMMSKTTINMYERVAALETRIRILESQVPNINLISKN